MKLYKNIRTIGLAACAGLAFASCDVELLPLDTVILENYWTNKDDVNSVVTSCYQGLTSSDVVNRMIVWGECRSDNIKEGKRISSAGNDLKYLLNGNTLETNSYCQWSSFYTIINRCNTVEKYAPVVQQRDPNFTESDLYQTLAEVKTIRALCYFYLVRTFGDVPFTTEASIDDDQEYVIPATDDGLILDTLITDLEQNGMYAPKRYVVEDENSGKITRNAVYALLADMYLWRASDAQLDAAKRNALYLKCVEYCDKVIEAKVDEYKEDRYGSLKRQIDNEIYSETGYPLIQEWAESDQTSGQGTNAKAYNRIFGTGHSFESIFELSFSSNQTSQGTTNSAVANMYGSNDTGFANGAYVAANENMLSTEATATYDYDNGNVFTSYDFRSQSFFQWDESSSFTISKYVCDKMAVNVGTASVWSKGVKSTTYTPRTQNYANWIIYRLTDIMLMKAEAEVQLADYIDNSVVPEETTEETTEETAGEAKTRNAYGNVYSTSKEYYDDAFNIVDAIYSRSAPNATAAASPNKASLTGKTMYDNLIGDERRRELMFEGKRYYDLLRRARREGSTSYVASKISSKFTSNASAMGIKMAMMEFLYMPYAKKELDRNPLLKQNKAYDKEKKNERNF